MLHNLKNNSNQKNKIQSDKNMTLCLLQKSMYIQTKKAGNLEK